jgi:hypothetical protein
VGEKAGAGKCDDITWIEKISIGVKATPENT